jgi:SAM-dependent methyltransferase
MKKRALPPGKSWQEQALEAGSSEHYADPLLYDHEYRRRRDDVRWYRALARQLACEAAERRRPLRVLELGCGTGRLLVPLVRDGHLVVGVDRSPAMLTRCAQRLKTLGPAARGRGQLVRADMRALPLASAGPLGKRARGPQASPGSDGFALIVCPFNGFMHLYTRHDVEQCLAQVRRLLQPGGLLALDVLNPDPEWLARDPLRRWARTRFRHPGSGERLIYSTNHVYDPAGQICWIRLYYEPDAAAPASEPGPAAAPSKDAWTVQLAHRQFYPAELEALLHYNGFTVIQHLGGFDGQPISPVSVEQVICARVR